MPIALAIHGGAGLIRRASLSAEREAASRASLLRIVTAGHGLLARGATAHEAVIEAVRLLEDDPLFNAGHGAVLASDGSVELDAAVMEGTERRAGAVAAVSGVRNPVRLADRVLRDTPHVLLAGPGAQALAQELGEALVDPSALVTAERAAQLERAKARGSFHLDHGSDERDVYGTVGAVACDEHGRVAAATSTGGMVNQRPGRVGDTPLIGAGTFAWDRTCAVSGTGHGEPFIRLGLAARVSARVEMLGESLAEAADRTLDDLAALGGQGGLIAVNAQGQVVLPFNTAGMFRAWQTGAEEPAVGIW